MEHTDYRDPGLTPEARARDLLSRMSLHEMVGQLNQRLYGFSCYGREGQTLSLSETFCREAERWGGIGVLYGLYRADPWSGRDFATGLPGVLAKKAYNLAQHYVISRSRFGIPMLLSTECPHGHQALGGYLLPAGLAMGASWDPALVQDAFHVCGLQMKELGVDLALISMLDVLRDPRWGRSEECYGEDPFLCARFAQSAVRGCQSAGVGVVAKHFCAQGEGTGGVNASAARIGERELREIHLPPAEAAVRAGAVGVMAAYNEIDGVPCHANRRLLTDLLRGEYGFDGVLMSDGLAVDRLEALTDGDTTAAGALALGAGVDVGLWDKGFAALEQAVERGLVPEACVREAAFRVLRLKFARGLFEHPYLEETEPKVYGPADFPQSRRLAEGSAVLLKNNGILPLRTDAMRSVAVLGPNADSLYNQLGDYSPPLAPGSGVTVLQGIRAVLEPLGVQVRHASGCSVCGRETGGIGEAVALAAACDVTVLVLGGSSSRFGGAQFDDNGAARSYGLADMDCGEGVDCAGLSLPGVQEELVKAVAALHKPLVAVVIAGRPYALGASAELSNAMLYAFYPGPQSGAALADLLFGRVQPSGCLPVSIPRSAGQLPAYYNPRASYEAMRYRDLPQTPLFPFGYGLHYTEISVSGVSAGQEVSRAALEQGEKVRVTCRVRNGGTLPGHAVLQLYLHARGGSVVRRAKELKAFQKFFLVPGEEKECALELGREELSAWGKEMRFAPEPGTVDLFLEESGRHVWTGTLCID